MDIKDAYIAQELAPILGVTDRAIRDRASREGWQSRPRTGRGGGNEWLLSSMPEKTRLTIILAASPDPSEQNRQNLPALPGTLPTCTALAPIPQMSILPATLAVSPSEKAFSQHSGKEREVAIARKAFVTAIFNLEIGSTRNAAIAKLLKAAESGSLPVHLAGQIECANARFGSGTGRGLSRRRLYDWCAAYEKSGDAGLAPRDPQKDMSPPAWLNVFLTLWQRPGKPSVAQSYDEFLEVVKWVGKGCPERGLRLPPIPQAEEVAKLPQLPALAELAKNPGLVPSVHAVRRWIDKMGTIDRMQGRMTGNELLRLKAYKQRTTYHMLPTDWYTADGTTLDAEVINPEDGKPMKAELVLILDVVTRKCVGASFGKAENALIVLSALRVACCAFGVPAAIYSDNGPGYKNKMLGDAYTDGGRGVLARVGITPKRAIPGRPRGKGLMERGVKTISDRISKSLPSCTHADMDKDSAHNIYKLSRKQIKQTGATEILPQWRATLEVIGREIDAYNMRPHTKLPKFTDATGKVRHYSPNEYWQKFVDEGFVPEDVPDALRDTLFRPSVFRTVSNAKVMFARHTYFAKELEPFGGDRVEVRYDEWDCTQVSVWTLEGRKICDVDLNGNATLYVEQAELEEQRANRHQALTEAARAALPVGTEAALSEGQQAIDAVFTEIETVVVDSLTGGRASAYVPRQHGESEKETGCFRYYNPPAPNDGSDDEQDETLSDARPTFSNSSDKYIWLMQHKDLWTPQDVEWLHRYVVSDEYFDFLDYYEPRGLAWEEPKCVNSL